MKTTPAKSQLEANLLHNGFTPSLNASQMVHRYSIKIVARKEAIRKDGTVPVQLQAIINRKRAAIGLSLNCAPNEFDEHAEKIRYSKSKDNTGALTNEANFTIDQARVRAQQIFNKYRYLNKPLTTELFKKEFETAIVNSSLLSFIEHTVIKEYQNVLTKGTLKNWRSVYLQIEKYKPSSGFAEVNELWVDQFDNFMRKRGISMNTRMKYHKICKRFFKEAIKHHYLADNPYKDFKIKQVSGNRVSLTMDEVQRILTLFKDKRLNDTDQNELKNFVFCLLTGLRYSDLAQITNFNVVGDVLVFTPVKTKYIGNVIQVPLNDLAKRFIAENIDGKVFKVHSNEHMNRTLKLVAEACGIKKNITTHVARHTFATLYLEFGGDVVSLKNILGHRKLETTMKYVHLSNALGKEGVKNFDIKFGAALKE